jgi:hypothetical protein
MNQIGNDGGAVSHGEQDTTSRVVAALLRSRVGILLHQPSETGDIRFALPLKPLRLTKSDLSQMPMLRTNAFVDFAGEFLVRKHLGRFDDLVLRPDFDQIVRKYSHAHFGLWFDEGSIAFGFHASLLNRLFNQELAGILTHDSDSDSPGK